MAKPKVACVGGGVVGTAMRKLCGPETVVYDIRDEPGYTQDKGEVNACDVAFVNVPTPMSDDRACDTSIVEEVVDWERDGRAQVAHLTRFEGRREPSFFDSVPPVDEPTGRGQGRPAAADTLGH